MSISAVINTLNEEQNLPHALRSVAPWVDEIVVVDMHSEDATVRIASEYGARVFQHDRVGYADPARAFALAQATSDWLLVLDADELVPKPLSVRLRQIANSGEYDAVSIPWLNYLLGAPLMHAGWGPEQDRHVRFFRRGAVVARPDIHDYLHVRDGTRVLSLPYAPGLAVVHFNYLDLAHFVEKLNRYTDVEAARLANRSARTGSGAALYLAIREFGRRYIRERGYRAGWRGFYLSALMSGYRLLTVGKARERERTGGRDKVREQYAAEAERWLEDYRSSASSE